MMVMATILAIAMILAQGAAVWGFLRFVKSFGAYTEAQQALTSAILSTHELNLALHRENQRILEELQTLHQQSRKVVGA